MATASTSDLRPLLTPVVEASGFDLEDVVVTPVGRRSLVRITVDSDDGVDLDAIALISRAVAEALDASITPFGTRPGGESGGGAYTLEVSSPGVDRPLSLPRHWRRSVGRLVTVTAAGHPVTGRVQQADDAAVTLQVGDDVQTFALSDLGPGRVQVEFSRPSSAASPLEEG